VHTILAHDRRTASLGATPPGAVSGIRPQVRTGFTGVWRGGVNLIGVAFDGVGFIGGRSVAMVEWNVIPGTVRTLCSGIVSHR
jgi:hypothetical protein